MVEIGRRDFLKGSIAAGALALPFGRPMAGEVATLPFANGERPLVAYPGKRPLLQTTARPPQLETPFQVFDEGVITPNDAFFVRYHLADIPTSIDPDLFRLEISGHVDRPIFLSLKELKSLPVIDLVAVNQCSGNSRGFILPRVAGGQLGNGAMGNARWTGVSLKSVLDKAGVKQGAVQVGVHTVSDGPVLSETPRYAKALAIDHVEDGEVMLAWAMNGEELPWLNGYPLRARGTGFLRHLLDQAPELDHGAGHPLRWVLDAEGLSHPRQRVCLCRAGSRLGEDGTDPSAARSLIHHQPDGWCDGSRRNGSSARYRLRWRFRHYGRRHLVG